MGGNLNGLKIEFDEILRNLGKLITFSYWKVLQSWQSVSLGVSESSGSWWPVRWKEEELNETLLNR
jgi:hypothetical protein